jgi:hypothetical protein
MECEPSVSDDIVSAAAPPPANVALPSAVAPSLNVNVPMGVPAACHRCGEGHGLADLARIKQ